MADFNEPFAAMLALQRALKSRRESRWMQGGTTGMGAYPPTNIFQKGADFVAVIELPGIDKKDLQIEAKDNTIRISGKKAPDYDQNASVHRRERVFGTFDRTISLPVQIDADTIRARIPRRDVSFVHTAGGQRKAAHHKDQLTRIVMTEQELQVQRKREVERDQESTSTGTSFLPVADIFETPEALRVVLEMPGVGKNSVEVSVENNLLTIVGRIDFANYEGLRPLYTEYNIGHYSRSFRLSNEIEQEAYQGRVEGWRHYARPAQS